MFNRKERNLLIRDMLGGPDLSEGFSERLAQALVVIPEKSLKSAWWATDFHFDWLAGALLTFVKGERLSRELVQGNQPKLVQGNQQDLDVIVAAYDPAPTAETRHHLILMEAKAYSYFATKQHSGVSTKDERGVAGCADAEIGSSILSPDDHPTPEPDFEGSHGA